MSKTVSFHANVGELDCDQDEATSVLIKYSKLKIRNNKFIIHLLCLSMYVMSIFQLAHSNNYGLKLSLYTKD